MKKIYILHTGGTLCMVESAHGLRPQKGLVETAIAEMKSGEIKPGGLFSDVGITVENFNPLVDSANITFDVWNRLLDRIEAINADIGGGDEGGIVITHGTDSMAYTGAALSLVTGGLVLRERAAAIRTPIILTGAMKPFGALDSDAGENLQGAIRVACGEGLKGDENNVWLWFSGMLLAADRLIKTADPSAGAFEAKKHLPLFEGVLAQKSRVREFRSSKIGLVSASPELPAEALGAMIKKLDGVVLRCFGSGTFPSNPAFLKQLSVEIKRGLRVIAVSQANHGAVSLGHYEAGHELAEIGVMDGRTMTAELAFARLALLISEEKTG